MKDGLRRHLRRTYAAIIAIALISIVALGGFIACIWQLNDLLRRTDASVSLYAARIARVGTITSPAQIERVIAGTSHPGCVLRIALARTRYIVTWNPLTIRLVPRASIDGAFSMRLVDRLGGVPSLLGGHAIVNSYEVALVPIGPVQTILIRTFAASALAALIVVVFALLISRRMARDTLKPLRALYQALKDAAAGHHPAAVPQMGRDEIGELIATYNAAIDAERKAQLARDAAEARTHQFIADAGHQLRTPITVLSGFIGILRSGRLRSPDDGPQILQKMDQQITTISTLVDRLMLLDSWQSTDRPNLEVIDVGELVTTIVDPIASTHPERTFHFEIAHDATAAVDRDEFTYAISNIVTNAVKYAPESPITVSVRSDERSVQITIADEGPGIPAEELPHIFERFYRGSRRQVSGSGLGLAIAKVAVERSNGTIRVRSEAPGGSEFTITLPRAA